MFVIEVFVLILRSTLAAANRTTLQIPCCFWNLAHAEVYLHEVTQKPMLSVAHRGLHDGHSPGAPALQSAGAQPVLTTHLGAHLMWFMANKSLHSCLWKLPQLPSSGRFAGPGWSQYLLQESARLNCQPWAVAESVRISHGCVGNISAYLLGNHRLYAGCWQTLLRLGPGQWTESRSWQGLQGSISMSHIHGVNELKEWSS